MNQRSLSWRWIIFANNFAFKLSHSLLRAFKIDIAEVEDKATRKILLEIDNLIQPPSNLIVYHSEETKKKWGRSSIGSCKLLLKLLAVSRRRSKGRVNKFSSKNSFHRGIGSRGKIHSNRIISESKDFIKK